MRGYAAAGAAGAAGTEFREVIFYAQASQTLQISTEKDVHFDPKSSQAPLGIPRCPKGAPRLYIYIYMPKVKFITNQLAMRVGDAPLAPFGSNLRFRIWFKKKMLCSLPKKPLRERRRRGPKLVFKNDAIFAPDKAPAGA